MNDQEMQAAFAEAKAALEKGTATSSAIKEKLAAFISQYAGPKGSTGHAQRVGKTLAALREAIDDDPDHELANLTFDGMTIEQLLAGAESIDQQTADLLQKMDNIRLLQEVTNHRKSNRPWMEAMEAMYSAMKWAALRPVTQDLPSEGDEYSAFERNAEVRVLKMADCYAWSNETIAACRVAARTVPGDVKLSSLVFPGEIGWWYFGDGFQARTSEWQDDDRLVAILWARAYSHQTQQFGLNVWTYVISAGRPTSSLMWTWYDNETLDELLTRLVWRQAGAEINQFIASALCWLNQRILSTSSGHVERHYRKRATQDYKLPRPLHEVKVVELRRLEQHRRDQDAGRTPQDVAWSCQWVVNGHHRNQYYPSTGQHKLIFINAFMKGPAGMPLRVPKATIYKVDR